MKPLKQPGGALPAGALALLVGGVVLLGWALDIAALKSVLPGWVSMKPNTAVAFILTGIALLAGSTHGAQQSNLLARLSRFCALFAGLIGLLSLGEYAFGWNPGFDQWLFPEPAGTVGTSHPGRMAPDTALCFVLFAAGWELTRWRQSKRTLGAALLFGAAMTTVALIEILSYFAPALRTYGWGGLTMMALPTATLFAALGMTLLLAARPEPAAPAQSIVHADARTGLKLVLVFVALTIAIIATGTFYYRNYERQFRTEAEQQLTAIAELKVIELVQYRKERLDDAAMLHKNPAFTQLARRFLASPADSEAQRLLQAWLDKYHVEFGYDRISMLNVHGVTRLSVPAGRLTSVSSDIARGASEVLRSGQVKFQDFYRDEHDQRIYLAVLVPILDPTDGNRPQGVIALRLDPAVYLYPFLSRWPVPSGTAETLLVRREGNEAVFLNELRFHKNSALTLRVPLSNTTMPAVKAARGQEGAVEGLDYRGMSVLAALHAVPDSPWFLVARRDLAEVYAPLRTQLWQVIGMITLLIFSAGTGVGLVWRQQQVKFYKETAETDAALQKSQNLLREAEKLGRVGGWEFDIETGQQTWTETVYAIHELDSTVRPTLEMGINFYTPAFRPVIAQAVQRAIHQGEPFDLELEIITAKDNRRNVHVIGKADPKRGTVSGFFQDITGLKQAEQALRDSEEKYRALVTNLSFGVVVHAPDSSIIYSNPMASTLLGLTKDQLRGKEAMDPAWSFLRENGMALPLAEYPVNRVLSSGEPVTNQVLGIRRPDLAEPVWVQCKSYPDSAADGTLRQVVVTFVDITERMNTEEAQRQSRRAALNMMTDAIEARERSEQLGREIHRLNVELEQRVVERTAEFKAANKELEAFCYSVSHDLRAPLRHIDGYVELLVSRCRADLSEKGLHYLDTIAASAQQMGVLIDDLLQFSRTGRVEMRLESTDMNKALQEALTTLRESTVGRRIEWIINELPSVQADHALLRQVWVNLLDNAVKYSRTRDVARITVSASREKGEIIFSVADNGVGFDMKYLHKLFGVFQRLHTQEEFEGTGIGLATVQRIITRHGGRIWAESGLNRGSTFYFTLPESTEENHV